MIHVNYPHEPGYLFDCPACEARCHCASPHHAECVFDGEHTRWEIGNCHMTHVAEQGIRDAVKGRIPLTQEEAQTIASWWQSPGSVGHVLAAFASGCAVDAREFIDDIDATMRHTQGMSTEDFWALIALREWVIARCA